VDSSDLDTGSAPTHGIRTRLRNQRVLVTGATGFIGANLVRAVLAAGAEVHAVVRAGSSTWRLEELQRDVRFHPADLADPVSLRRAFATARPDVLLHLAVPRGQDEAARVRIVRDNVLGAAHLIGLVREFGVGRVVVTGSSLEYGPQAGPLHEALALQPSTVHGVAKAAASLLFRQAALEHGIPVSILRLFHVYGPWESPHRLFPAAVRAARDGTRLPLTEPGIRRDWVFVDDVVDAVLRAVGLETRGEVLNIGSGRQYANEEVVAGVAAAVGHPIATDVGAFTARPADVTSRVADCAEAARQLGWRPRHDLASAVRRTLAWCDAHPTAWSVRDDAPPAIV
jgi:nucleoside-diphosphate-sugar epimerase